MSREKLLDTLDELEHFDALSEKGLNKVAQIQNILQNKLNQITKMQNQWQDKLEEIAKMRRIKTYEEMLKEGLIIISFNIKKQLSWTL